MIRDLCVDERMNSPLETRELRLRGLTHEAACIPTFCHPERAASPEVEVYSGLLRRQKDLAGAGQGIARRAQPLGTHGRSFAPRPGLAPRQSRRGASLSMTNASIAACVACP